MPVAQASEADWLYFPMYPRDTAHAVHLSALKFRPDGLLSSATRYPRVSQEPWTQEESDRGWYSYAQRLIDCETGYFVETSSTLLDRHGRLVASRQTQHADWLARLTEQTQRRINWPAKNEIFLACAGASSPTLKAVRARRARAPVPLISYAPLTQGLSADSDALYALQEMRYDLTRFTARPTATPVHLFEELRQQHARWRKSFNLPHAPSAGVPHAIRAEVQHKVNQWLQRTSPLPETVRLMDEGVVEYEADWLLPYGIVPPAKAQHAQYATETLRADCASGVSVPISRHWRDAQGQDLQPVKITVKDALAQARAVLERGHGQAPEICALVERMAAETVQPLGEARDPNQPGKNTVEPSLTVEDLAREKTPEAMLLRIRAAARSHHPDASS